MSGAFGARLISVRDLVRLGLLTMLLVAVKAALSWLPNVELVTLLLVLYSRHLGRKALYILYAFVLLEGIFYGFHLWWISYLYVWLIPIVLGRLFRHNRSALFWALICALFGLSFGALCLPPYLFAGGWAYAAATYVNGIPFDLVHCAGNFAAALLLFHPLDHLFRRYLS